MAAPKGFLIVPVGFRSDGTLRALELTDDDELKIAVASAAGSDLLTELESKLETTDLELVSKILSAGPHGWISGAWQRQPINLGYSDRITEQFSVTASNGGNYTASSTPVPDGEIHIIDFVSCYHNDPTSRSIIFYAYNGSADLRYRRTASLAQWVTDVSTVSMVLKYQDKINITAFSLGDTYTLYGELWGRKIDIDQ